MTKKHQRLLHVVVIGLLFAVSCTGDRLDIDVSDIEVDVKIKRFDEALFKTPPEQIPEKIPEWKEEFGEFYTIYNQSVLAIGSSDSPGYVQQLRGFSSHPDYREVYQECQKNFPDLSRLNNELTEAFKHYKYYFPNDTIPSIYTCISGFNYRVFTGEKSIGIGLDMFLGPEADFYKQLVGWHNYMRYMVYPQRITPDCMYAWAKAEYPYNDSINNLLSQMIYYGKLKYFTEAMMPDAPDSLIMGYTEHEIEWCKASEEAMWRFIIEEDYLYSTNILDIKKFINDGPFTHFFSRESPSRSGVWIGWQIIRSFMENNPEITLARLMRENDYQSILNRARYKP